MIDWLRDDEIRGNGMAAGAELSQRAKIVKHQAEIIQLLEPHILSEDLQLQEVAVGILQKIGRIDVGQRALSKQSVTFPASPAMLTASIDLLKNYTTCRTPKWILGSAYQQDCVLYLLRQGQSHFKDVELKLYHAMNTSAEYQRWIYAFLLAHLDSKSSTQRIAQILMKQLRDNIQHDDALMCINALYHMGRKIAPLARETLESSSDRQQIACLKLLLHELFPQSAGEISRNELRRLNVLTWKCANPIRSWKFGRDSHI
ncbi:MAG: hypothetical protein HQ519_04270 [Planctomycetes bacterium]|nr:hypothetical protein [Planctomycetota bacterium]